MEAREYVEILRKMLVDHPESRAFYDWVLERGESFRQDPCSPECKKFIRSYCSGLRFKAKECYYNAWRLAAYGRPEGVKFYEGWAISIIPTEHAWAVYKGMVLDPTWKRIADPGQEISYFGIELPILYVTERTAKSGMIEPNLARYWYDKVKL